jgi:diguanylate cyclase (GGDEF)-like protein/PAS domain S-box-containing protein
MPKFYAWNNFYVAQTVIFAMLFSAFYFVFKATKIRQQTIYRQYEKIFLSEEKMYSTLLSVGDGVITVGMDGYIELINPVAEKLTGWTQEMAQGQPIESVFKIVNEYTREEVRSPIELVFETEDIIQLANHTLLISKDGSESAIEDTAAPIKDKSGQITGCILVFRDFSEKMGRQKHIEFLSFHDQLTGLYNRRFFEEEMERIDKKRNLPLTIVYADVNGLKTINDAFGHDRGDQLIQMVADILKKACRADDIIARVGGDEFIVLLPHTDTLAASSLVSRIKEKLDKATIMDIHISVSFGWNTKIDESQAAPDVLKIAENLMYQKKIQERSNKRNDVIEAILKTMQVKWPEEEAHSTGVSKLCEAIGRAYNLSDEKIEELRTLGKLHDIGKIAIDRSILNKTGPLSDSEWAQIKTHPETGFRLLGSSSQFNKLAQDVLAHHEKWDGTGYPKGLKGEEISWKARVIAVAETYEAMINERPYRPAFSEKEAIAEIKQNAGTQFDPKIVKVFLEQVIHASI